MLCCYILLGRFVISFSFCDARTRFQTGSTLTMDPSYSGEHPAPARVPDVIHTSDRVSECSRSETAFIMIFGNIFCSCIQS